MVGGVPLDEMAPGLPATGKYVKAVSARRGRVPLMVALPPSPPWLPALRVEAPLESEHETLDRLREAAFCNRPQARLGAPQRTGSSIVVTCEAGRRASYGDLVRAARILTRNECSCTIKTTLGSFGIVGALRMRQTPVRFPPPNRNDKADDTEVETR